MRWCLPPSPHYSFKPLYHLVTSFKLVFVQAATFRDCSFHTGKKAFSLSDYFDATLKIWTLRLLFVQIAKAPQVFSIKIEYRFKLLVQTENINTIYCNFHGGYTKSGSLWVVFCFHLMCEEKLKDIAGHDPCSLPFPNLFITFVETVEKHLNNTYTKILKATISIATFLQKTGMEG